MTDAEFEQAASYVDDRSWMTGENLIHVPSVMNVEGWNFYGHPGHMLLTSAQRTLMMWSDVVGQVSNGGFDQFCDNYVNDLAAGLAAVDALDWAELRERFRRAMTEQAGNADEPRRLQPLSLSDDPEKWRVSRKRLLRYLARRGKRWWQPTTARDLAFVEARFDAEWQVELKYQMMVASGELRSGGERLFDFVSPPSDEFDAFDDWFYTDDTKAASAFYVHEFIVRHRDQLYRPI
ncbi:DMP19 family protein [Sphingomonas sp. CFBP 8760]|uniref:DMP19 family protein n=1 Tax=Sphingomonas sp. CFBP 8760 TaxID=2775282 RepID=UPI001A929540|nr:DUF4375 domain-containing protein [Sphingomonas sp. CFBP 8760]